MSGGQVRGDRAPLDQARRLVTVALPAVLAFGLFALIWQLVAAHNSDYLPSIGVIADDLGGNLSAYGHDALVTLSEVAAGLALSFAVAFSLAVLIIQVPTIERAVMPLAVVLNVTPIVALAPGLSVALGIGAAPRDLVTALIVFFPLLVNSLTGLRSIDPEALEVLRTLHASRREILLRLRLPSSLPFLFVAARICLPLATIGAVVAEFSTSGTNSGLGSAIEASIQYSDFTSIYAAIFCLAVMGLLLTLLVVLAERRLLRWHPAGQSRLGRGLTVGD